MPNYVKNIVTFKLNEKESEEHLSIEEQENKLKEEINTNLLHIILNEKHLFDFNILIPSPDTDANWYNFRLDNWGTKWNANGSPLIEDDIDFDDYIKENICNQFEFDTAWSTPYAYFVTLSKKIPQLNIHVIFADEDMGCNCGFYILNDGELLESITDRTHPEQNWRKFAFHTRYGEDANPEDYELNSDYEYEEYEEDDDDE